jgi:26S proteasome regulatory subunit T6
MTTVAAADGLRGYFQSKLDSLDLLHQSRSLNLQRLEAQRNDLNARVRRLRDELSLLHEPASYVGEVVKVMGKNRILVKVHPEGKYVVELDKALIDSGTVVAENARVALRNDSYALHKVHAMQNKTTTYGNLHESNRY